MINEKLKQYITGRPQHLSMQISKEQLAAADPEKKIITCSFAAESYVDRWYGILVLNFDPASVDLSRWSAGVPYLMNHDTCDQRGIILNGRLENGVLLGDVKFSNGEDGTELYQDIIDGIRPWTSVGFDIQDIREIPAEEMPEDLKNMCIDRQCCAYKIEKWAPYEGSSVSIPANPGVGVQMSHFDGENPEEIQVLAEQFGIQKFSKKQSEIKPSIITTHKEDTMSVKKTPEQLASEKAALLQFGANYESRVAGGKATIEKLANDVVELFANSESDEIESRFRGEIFTRINDNERLETPATFLDMTESQKQEYSITKVLRSLVDGTKLTGIEAEVAEALEKKGVTSRTGGVVLPLDLQSRNVGFDAELRHHLTKAGIRMTERFDQTVGSTTGGGYLVGTQHRAQDFVEIYRNFLIPGFTYLPGLQQSVDIPKQTGGSTITVASSEGNGFSETALTFGQLALSPKEIGAYIEITRKLLVQSTPAIDNLVVIDLMRQLALKTNYLALFGSGGSGEPTGAFVTSNIGTFDGTGLGRAGALDAMADIGTANVVGKLNWLCNSATKALLMGKDQTAGYGRWLMDDNGTMIGYDSIVSEQMSGTSLALIKLDEVVVGSFGTMEINYDRSTMSASGGLRIAAYDLIDAGLKHPGAVSYASSVS